MTLKRRTDLLPARLKDLSNEFINDVKLNQMNLNEKTMESPALKSKWVMIYMEEKKYLAHLKEAKDALLDKYIVDHGLPNIPKKVVEKKAEQAASEDNDIVKINKGIKDQKQVVEYLEFTNKIVLGFGFDLKNCNDLLRLES